VLHQSKFGAIRTYYQTMPHSETATSFQTSMYTLKLPSTGPQIAIRTVKLCGGDVSTVFNDIGTGCSMMKLSKKQCHESGRINQRQVIVALSINTLGND